MTLHPILAALRKHKAGVVLIAMQIALTLAIVCNAVFIIGQRIERVNRPTGLDESNLFLVTQQWVGAPGEDVPGGVDKLDAMQLEDLAALRQLPDVVSVAPINSMPLLGSSWNGPIANKPGDTRGGGKSLTFTTYYFTDEQMLPTLGVRVIAGRAFNAGDVQHQGFRDQRDPDIVMLTKALADKLFPKGAVGKVVYLNGGTKPVIVVGVVERMQVPFAGGDDERSWNSTMIPARLNANFSRYAVRTKPGRLDDVMRAVTPALYKVNPMRVLDDDSVRSFAEIRDKAYRADLGMAILMGVVCLILLCVTAAGIVGLTSFWVGQRHRQIGVLLAVGLNQWLMSHYEMTRIPVLYVLTGVLAMLAIGQAAVFVPARRASNVAPVVATRAV
jgi:putative ABC transport system permease protein